MSTFDREALLAHQQSDDPQQMGSAYSDYSATWRYEDGRVAEMGAPHPVVSLAEVCEERIGGNVRCGQRPTLEVRWLGRWYDQDWTALFCDLHGERYARHAGVVHVNEGGSEVAYHIEVRAHEAHPLRMEAVK